VGGPSPPRLGSAPPYSGVVCLVKWSELSFRSVGVVLFRAILSLSHQGPSCIPMHAALGCMFVLAGGASAVE
jgi:hypothetical protein